MATYRITANTTAGSNTLADLDRWIVEAGVLVDVADDNAFFGVKSFTNNYFRIEGTVQTTGNFITMLMKANETRVVIAATGTVSSVTTAIELQGDRSSLINSGTIDATFFAVKILGENSFFKNEVGAVITSDNTAVLLAGSKSDAENYGSISGVVGVNIRASTANYDFYNDGTITGTQYAILGGNSNERIINDGTITGDVLLRNGDDFIDTTSGTVNGDIYGGNGDDLYRIDDTGLTLVEFANGGTDRVAIGQTYTLADFIENLTLLTAGDLDGTGNAQNNQIDGTVGDNVLTGLGGSDRLYGDDGADTLVGGAGFDRLFGGNGIDILRGEGGKDLLDGGAGNDRLTGGAAADKFIFADGYGIDRVTDFTAVGRFHDVLDLSGLDGITNFRDLKLSHMTQVGNNVVITDGADKIVLLRVDIADLNAVDFLF